MWSLTAIIALAPGPWPPVFAAERPSLFRGVVVTDSPVGVRVVSVEESSQAYRADLRPEDIIVRVDGQEVQSIDDFARLSLALRGEAVSTTVVVFRRGQPREVAVHLYSYPVLTTWGIAFVPDHGIRFAEAQTGLAHWARMGRGFLEAGRPAEALTAYLNGLHNAPTDLPMAFKAAELLWQVGRTRLERGELSDGIASLQQAAEMLRRLFEEPLTEAQLRTVKDQLRETLEVLRGVLIQPEKPS